MKTEIHRLGEECMTLSEFADRHDLTMVVKERCRSMDPSRFYAAFADIEVIGSAGTLTRITGDGPTPEGAIAHYARQIAGSRLTRDAGRTEFSSPNAWLSEPKPPEPEPPRVSVPSLPRSLPAGTWIRGMLGPMQTYQECFLSHDSKGPFYCGGAGSAKLCFTPDHVHWLALTSDEERKRIARIESDYQSLGVAGLPKHPEST